MLVVGKNKSPILSNLTLPFLLIDDGPLIDELEATFTFPKRRKVQRFDYRTHSFSPLRDMSYTKARDFVAILDAVFPEGANTLTKKNANFLILSALLHHPRKLERLIEPNENNPAQTDAYQKIQTLLLSPVLDRVLNRSTNFWPTGTILARISRAELGDFDAFVLGNFLMQQYQGEIIVPDFGFYGAPHHVSLMRQDRLRAGVNFLDEVPLKLRQNLLLMDEKIASGATYDDAETLAIHSGGSPGTVGFGDDIDEGMR